MGRAEHLRAGGVSVVVDVSGPQVPGIAYWGADLGELDEAGLGGVLALTAPPAVGQGPDVPVRLALLPEHATGWLGRPGLAGSRADGTAWAPAFQLQSVERPREQTLTLTAAATGLRLVTELELSPQGLLRVRHALENTGGTPYRLEGLAVALPVPAAAQELLDLAGRWARERSPQRRPFQVGTWLREARGGRSGLDSPTVLVASTPGVGFGHGEAWGIHLGWAGNASWWAERSFSGDAVLAAGELLQPGELELAAGESYTSPWVYASWSNQGLDGLSARFHEWLRARPPASLADD